MAVDFTQFGNPLLDSEEPRLVEIEDTEATITMGGVVYKTLFLLLLNGLGASFPWLIDFTNPNDPSLAIMILISLSGALIAAMVTNARKDLAQITAPTYAFLQGIALGSIAVAIEYFAPGITLPALVLTFGVLAMMLIIWRASLIRSLGKFRAGLIAFTAVLFAVYMSGFVLLVFGAQWTALTNHNLIHVGINAVIVMVASMNLMLDFERVDRAIQYGSPRQFEWFAAFALIVTLVWMYASVLRLLWRIRMKR